MKILYIANDRCAAELAAFALRTVAPDVAIVWGERLGEARRWIDENPDVATIIVEAESDNPSCESFVSDVRSLGGTAPVIVVSETDPAPPLTALEAVVDRIVTKNQSFLNDLPVIVKRTLETARSAARQQLRLLHVGDAALARLNEAVAATTAARQKLEQQLADRDVALRRAEQRATSERQTASQDFARRQTELEAALADEAAQRRTLERKLAQADASHQSAELLWLAAAAASADKLTQQQAEFSTGIAQAAQARDALGQRLAGATLALQRAEQQHGSEMAEAAAATQALESRLADSAAALTRAEGQATAERHAATEEAAQRQAEYDAELARGATNRQALENALADAATARQRAEQQHGSEMAEAAARLADHRQQSETQLAEAAAATQALESRLADTAAALSRAEGQATAERHAATEEAAQRQAEYDAELARGATNRQALENALADAATARQRAEQQHGSEMAEAAARLADHRQHAETQLAEAAAATQALESRLADTAAALTRAEGQATAERQTAAEQAAQCQARFDSELRQEVAWRHAVEEELADTRAASEQVRLGLLDHVAAMRQHETGLEERAARERADWESTQVEDRERIQHLQMESDLARQSLVATEEQIQRLQSAHEEERANFERALERISQDRASEGAKLDALVADVEHRLHLSLAAGNRDSLAIAQLQEQLKALGEELETTKGQREVLKAAASLVPQLHRQIGEIRAENRHRFDNNPVNMCRCSRDGAITRVNHALASMLGYTPEEMQQVNFAATVFESGDELQWIVDRCLASRSTESVETTWRRKNGTRIIVRVLAVATTADSIDLAAQDITTFRELEERLRNSQRMEAVARYASEVAVNCDNLLRHVKEEGEQWLARIDSGAARQQGELLLDEVTRAAGFLRQLGVYGNEQKNAPELVEVNKLLRDMEPVLKRVAGSNIELVLPKASAPLNLDVEAERVERMLVNVAAYGRERMPFGGRLMIEVDSVVVDRTFVAKYPNVRPGAHVLLTVNEVRGAVRPDFSSALRAQGSGADSTASASDNPGVDLGALQALVSDSGGHLWMMAEPPGDMVLKIHLPRRVLDYLDPRVPAKQSRPRWKDRLSGTWH